MRTIGLVGSWLKSLAHSMPQASGREFRLPRVRVPGGEGRKGHWDEPVGAPKNKFATTSRQQRRRAGFKVRVAALNAEFGFNMSRDVRRSIAWDSWRAV